MDAALIDSLVEAFGCKTQAAFARILGTERRVVNNWKRDGLPFARRYQIEALARERGVTLPAQFHVAKAA
ncbi:MAG: hypothetical protein AB7O44_27590 [Hyphomicrobiaceae bacterium]